MRYSKLFFILILAGLILEPVVSSSQVTTPPTSSKDSLLTIEILPGVRKLEFRKTDDSTQLQILAGNVALKQGTTFFYSDSCVINNRNNTFEAWGRVHINDADTTNIYYTVQSIIIDHVAKSAIRVGRKTQFFISGT